MVNKLTKNNSDFERDQAVDDLFKNIQMEGASEVELPSEGRFYSNSSPTVTVRPLTFSDEKDLAVSLQQKTNIVNIILSKCVDGIKVNDLLLIDKIVLLLKIREISYGSNYDVKVTCPKCAAESEISIDLSKLLISKIPQDINYEREIMLPKLKVPAVVRFLKVSDEPFIKNISDIYKNLWRFVISINGVKDPVYINKVIERMISMDSQTMLKEINRDDLGLDPRFILQCADCGKESEMGVPINDNFFSVT